MDRRMREQIDSLASDILAALEITVPIRSMENVVERLGGELRNSSSLDFTDDGRIERIGTEKEFSIVVPAEQSEKRKNFTIAHELGHLFLHMGYLIDDRLWERTKSDTFYRKGSSERENQANEFAAAFLMPKEDYKEVLDKYTENEVADLSKVADYFNVSIDAAAYRGKWLGYLQW